MTKAIALAVLLLGATSSVRTVHAQPVLADDKKAEAKALYEKGLNHYNLGEFDPAIAAFRAAYAISSAPGLLFNIAQSFRLKKDYEQASYFYTTYLRLKPDAPNRSDVEQRIAEMDKLVEEQKKMGFRPPTGTVNPEGDSKSGPTTTTTPPTTTTTPTPPTTTTTPAVTTAPTSTDPVDAPPASGGNSLKLGGYAAMGAGGAFILTGLIFGKMASSAESDLNELNNGGTWSPAAQDRYDAGRRNNKIAIVTLVVGGAALATGGVLWFLGNKQASETSIAVHPTKGGTTVEVGWSF